LRALIFIGISFFYSLTDWALKIRGWQENAVLRPTVQFGGPDEASNLALFQPKLWPENDGGQRESEGRTNDGVDVAKGSKLR
jgi:hypothetical protein